MRFIAVRIFLLGTAALSPAFAEGPQAMAGEFQVNTYTTSYQESPAVAVAPSGGGRGGEFVLAWSSDGSYGTDSSGFSIQGQLYDDDDSENGTIFQANTYTTAGQTGVSAAVAPNGRFVLAWASHGSTGTDDLGSSVQARLYGAYGEPEGGEFQVNTSTQLNQGEPDVAMAGDGSFVVVWPNDGPGGTDPYSSIMGQRFASNGTPAGGEFLVNTYTTGYQSDPAVAMAADGRFVVVWGSRGSAGTDNDPTGYSVQAQRYAADGTPEGTEFQVNVFTPDFQYRPDVAASPGGDFVVVWASNGSYGTDSSFFSVQARSFKADGTPRTGELQVNTYTIGAQRSPAVAMSHSRDFLVVWQSDGSAGPDVDSGGILGQWISADGSFQGGEFQVNTYTTQLQISPAVAVAPNGDFLVAWSSLGSTGSDTDLTSVQARRFAGTIHTDGFEDGDLVLWSVESP